ncbi:DUF2268 domain-containing protein [Metabacillus herbersteinensis]
MSKKVEASSEMIENFNKEEFWKIVQKEEKKLRKEWAGPDVPIFILPCDERNTKIQREYKGRSGLAFKDKLFLFLSPNVKAIDIQSLFTHEYHHVCRLAKVQKAEKEFTILDTIIMEGLAENAVRERLGEDHVSSWTAKHTEKQAHLFLKTIIYPNRTMKRNDSQFTQLMYGTGFYPSMLGYFVGYHIVKSYIDSTRKRAKELISTESEEFFKSFD